MPIRMAQFVLRFEGLNGLDLLQSHSLVPAPPCLDVHNLSLLLSLEDVLPPDLGVVGFTVYRSAMSYE